MYRQRGGRGFTRPLSLALWIAGAPAWSGPPAGFYDAAAGLAGEPLAATLAVISNREHRPLSSRALWDAIAQTDEDPANRANVRTLYSNRSIPKVCREGRAQARCSETWNREHVWPKSRGFPQKSQWAHTDLHHLRAELPRCNSARGHLDFGTGGERVAGCATSKRHRGPDWWEPPREVQGDVARMLFYMAIRYTGGDAARDRTPDLRLVDEVAMGAAGPRMGARCMLLRWHEQDPVSPRERRRNDVIARLQGNRNPFIDHADFAQRIWGGACATPRPAVEVSPVP
ncbi:MAG: endonuclease [Paludibacterium sp.]|uniref:endonuclease I family protein n=1 Tax=Paludibacterium sp. TaxID=1917523 RepID=UPI0025FCB0E5|nr:endonuclease [Paludibacterium sp.]MBV8048743.1 endonuclease [Paludibacterium sp.]MBV8646076.1 endonuclease [Paludibacterium sp.]